MSEQGKPRTMSVKEAADILGVNNATVRVWINTGKLPAYKLPGSGAQSIIRIKKETFEAFVKAHCTTERNGNHYVR